MRETRVNIVAIRHPTFHTDAKDVGFPYPFAINPNILITRRYSGNTHNKNELVFRHILPVGLAAIRELMQNFCTAVDTAIRQSFEINILYTYASGDTVTIFTKRSRNNKATG